LTFSPPRLPEPASGDRTFRTQGPPALRWNPGLQAVSFFSVATVDGLAQVPRAFSRVPAGQRQAPSS
jgi:hypothetical protein